MYAPPSPHPLPLHTHTPGVLTFCSWPGRIVRLRDGCLTGLSRLDTESFSNSRATPFEPQCAPPLWPRGFEDGIRHPLFFSPWWWQ